MSDSESASLSTTPNSPLKLTKAPSGKRLVYKRRRYSPATTAFVMLLVTIVIITAIILIFIGLAQL